MPLMMKHVTPLQKEHHIQNKEHHDGLTLATKRRNGPTLTIGLNSHPTRGKGKTKAQASKGGEGKERIKTLKITRQTN